MTEPTTKVTLASLLKLLNDADEASQVMVDFDQAETASDLRDKIDAIHAVLTRLEMTEQWCKSMAEPFLKKAAALKANRQRLEAYVLYTMQQNKFQSIPGDLQKVRLRDNPVALKLLKDEPDAADFITFKEYVEPIRGYAWRKDRVKADLKAGSELPFAKLTQSQRIEFVPNIPEKLEGKKK